MVETVKCYAAQIFEIIGLSSRNYNGINSPIMLKTGNSLLKIHSGIFRRIAPPLGPCPSLLFLNPPPICEFTFDGATVRGVSVEIELKLDWSGLKKSNLFQIFHLIS